ncbi:DNA (cytosine-5-)-methyltransferase [Enterocloster bolteae]|nr:DNA (cytosine-5-)-methyltransferase [Enterocloster bolteae]
MYFLDFFAGIGLFRLGLEQAGWTCKGHCEIDKYANMSYQAMHRIKEGEWFEEDITKVSAQSLPDVDLWTGGFPCQDVSMAGERRGLYGERTGLFFEFVRLLRERGYHKPRWLILENVKGIFSSGGGWDFAIVLCELAALGYGVEYALVNSKDYGVPQSRERVYIIGDLTGRSTGKIFPLRNPGKTAPAQIIGGPQGSRIYDTGGVSPTITSGTGGLGAKTGLYFVAKDEQSGLVTKPYSGTIDASYGKGLGCRQHRTGILESRLPRALLNPGKEKTRQNGRRIKEEDEEMFTLTASDIHGILLDSRIRRLTPLETFRLQGVPDAYFERAASVCSDAQLYKQIGNAVTVPVVRAIGEKIAEYWKGEKYDSSDFLQ